MKDLTDLKEILYSMLDSISEQADGQADIKAQQNMGIALSNAVQKNGVNIVQIQSIVNIKLVTMITKALRLCDHLELADRLVASPYRQAIRAADRIDELKRIESKEVQHETEV